MPGDRLDELWRAGSLASEIEQNVRVDGVDLLLEAAAEVKRTAIERGDTTLAQGIADAICRIVDHNLTIKKSLRDDDTR